MKKAFTILAAMVLCFSISFAQVDNTKRQPMTKANTTVQKVDPNAQKIAIPVQNKDAKVQKQKMSREQAASLAMSSHRLMASTPVKPMFNKQHYRIGGNPGWGTTMSYCLDADYSTTIGAGGEVWWGIKIESAALVGRNNITDVMFYVVYPGTYDLSIYAGADPTGTAIATQSVEAVEEDAMSWKTIHFATPVAITQGQDLWITFHNEGVDYPAAAVVGTEYDNGKYCSLDGEEWTLITDYDMDYTWMIKAVTDTYTEVVPSVSITGPVSVRTNDTVSYTALSSNANSYVWTINADYQNTNAQNAQVMWTTAGMKQLAVAATNSVGTTTATLDVEVFSCDNITIPYAPSFTDGLGCWDNYSFLEEDFGWFTSSEMGLDEGQLVSMSAESFLGYFIIDADVDNWVVSPNIAMPATGNYEIAWKVRPYLTDYAGDHYGVYVIAGTDTTLLFEETLSEDMEDYVLREAAIPSTITGNFKFAFRHFNSEGGYVIILDEIELRSLSTAPQVTIAGPTAVQNGVPATFTAVAPLATTFAWTVDGTAVNEAGNVLTHTFTTDGSHTIAVTVSNTVGSDSASMVTEVYTCNAITQFPYSNGFEDGMHCWTKLSMDPANDNKFGIFDVEEAFEGTHYFQFSSYSHAEDYNQYLISPELQLSETSSYMVHFNYRSNHATDSFKLLVSSTTNDLTSFTELVDYTAIPSAWTEAFVMLPAGTKYVAFDYYANYQYYLYVDAISVEALTAPTVTVTGPTSVAEGALATFTATAPLATSFSWTVDGTAVNETSNTMSHTFTTVGTHTVAVTATNSEGSNTASMAVEVFGCEAITTFPYLQDFEDVAELGCWIFVDADGDGYNWDPDFCRDEINQNTGEYYGHNNSAGIIASASYINNVGALTPDNWMITPAITLPATGSYILSWYAKGQDASYALEHYAVYVSTTGAAPSDFTTVLYEGESTGAWEQYVANLSAYAGQTIRIAFRHYDVTDMFWLDIDDISIEPLTAPTVAINAPAMVQSGVPATFTAVAPLATSFAWTVDGTAVNESSNVLTHTFTTGGNHTVAVTASNSEGSSTASITVSVFACEQITNFPYTEDFENEATLDCWTFVDADGDGYNWDPSFLRDAINQTTGEGYGHNGSTGMIASASYINDIGALTPDNWMITPEIVLPNGSYQLKWYAKGQDNTYYAENYAVYVSTTGANINDFTTSLYEGTTTNAWVEYTADLSAYAGQTIRLAFRHYDVTDMFWLDVDDISITAGTGLDNHNMNISVYPNPATNNITVMGEGIQQVQILDIDGRTVMTFNEGGQLGIGSLANGIYMVRIVTDNGVQVNKIVKR